MIEYVIPHNPDDRVLTKATKLLKQGKLICIPTDTSWILAGSIENKEAIDKLYKIKKEGKQKHFSILCSDISMASDMALIDNAAFRTLKKIIPGHYTFIFEATKKIAKLVQASKTDKEVGIRFVPSQLVSALISNHGHPLITTNLTNKLLGLDDEFSEPIYSYMIEEVLLNTVDMIIDPGEVEFIGPSTIVDFSKEGMPAQIVRIGAGDISIF